MEDIGQDITLMTFLRELADSIEKKTLIPSQLQIIGEFYMSYQFQSQAIKDNDTSLVSNVNVDFDQEDIVKFFILGWFVYCVLLKNETLSSPPDVDDSEK